MSTQRQIAEDWLKYTISDWQGNIKKMNIHDTGQLYASFRGQVISRADGDVDKVKIAYAWYGKMVDMGAGRGRWGGTKREYARSKNRSERKRSPKNWYSNEDNGVFFQQMRLAQLLGHSYAVFGTDKIKKSIDESLTITF